jgi:hypothetical protein
MGHTLARNVSPSKPPNKNRKFRKSTISYETGKIGKSKKKSEITLDFPSQDVYATMYTHPDDSLPPMLSQLACGRALTTVSCHLAPDAPPTMLPLLELSCTTHRVQKLK